jgi:hypothetical protein
MALLFTPIVAAGANVRTSSDQRQLCAYDGRATVRGVEMRTGPMEVAR